jgi:phage/plasmid-like protein (TIGR03299 family)
MAHELSLRADGSAEMAFVGETPWHGLGQSVTKGASIGVWAKEAGMNWQADEARVFFTPAEDEAINKYDDPTEAEGYKMLYRSDSMAQLAIVGEDYQVVQPMDVLEFFRDLTETGGWHIHTAGCLRGGRKLWAMASNGDAANVGKGDQIRRNLLLATSLDGSMKTVAMETSVRVVCANTLSMALGRNVKGQVSTSHRTAFDPQLVKRALGVNQDNFKLFMERAKELADTPVALDQARDLLRTLFKVEEQAKLAPRLAWLGDLTKVDLEPAAKDTRAVGAILSLFNGEGMGSSLKTSKGTAWGLLNATTEYVDHFMGRTDDARLDAAWFGKGAQLKSQAVELITAL